MFVRCALEVGERSQDAERIFAAVVIFAAAAGVLIGGIVIRQLGLQVGGMLKMILVCHVRRLEAAAGGDKENETCECCKKCLFFQVIALVLILSFFIQCPSREFVGITTAYAGQE